MRQSFYWRLWILGEVLTMTGAVSFGGSTLDAWLEFNGAGRSYFIQANTKRKDCVEILSKLTNNLDTLWIALKSKPSLCELSEELQTVYEAKRVLERLQLRRYLITRTINNLQSQLVLIDQKTVEAKTFLFTMTNTGEKIPGSMRKRPAVTDEPEAPSSKKLNQDLQNDQKKESS